MIVSPISSHTMEQFEGPNIVDLREDYPGLNQPFRKSFSDILRKNTLLFRKWPSASGR